MLVPKSRARLFCCCTRGLVLRLCVVEVVDYKSDNNRQRRSSGLGMLREMDASGSGSGKEEYVVGSLVLSQTDLLAERAVGHAIWYPLHHDASTGAEMAGTHAGEVQLALEMVDDENLRLVVVACRGLSSSAAGASSGTRRGIKCEVTIDKTELPPTRTMCAVWGSTGTVGEKLTAQSLKGQAVATVAAAATDVVDDDDDDDDAAVDSDLNLVDAIVGEQEAHGEVEVEGWSAQWVSEEHTVSIADMLQRHKQRTHTNAQAVVAEPNTPASPAGLEAGAGSTDSTAFAAAAA